MAKRLPVQNTLKIATPKKVMNCRLVPTYHKRAICHAFSTMVAFSSGTDSSAITAVGIMENSSPETTLVRNSVSRRMGMACRALHIRELYRSPNSSMATSGAKSRFTSPMS